MRLGIIIPTNNPKDFLELALPSFKNLNDLRARNQITFLLNFQPPWTVEQIDFVIREVHALGFWVRHKVSAAARPASMFRLRYDCAMLGNDSDIFLIADDNLCYSAKGSLKYPKPTAVRYQECLNYFQLNPSCGAIMCEGYLGGNVAKGEIVRSGSGLVATTRGLFIRNVFGGKIFPEDSLNLLGSLEESVAVYYLMEHCYFLAKQFNNPTEHKNKHSKIKDEKDETHITHHSIIAANGEAYIRERYNDPKWTHDSRRFPNRIRP